MDPASTMNSPPADVCLVLEGTYPFETGGVSVWTDSLIRRMPERSFHLWCVVPECHTESPHYTLPPNVTGLTQLSLSDFLPCDGRAVDEARFWDDVQQLHRTWKANKIPFDWGPVEDLVERFGTYLDTPDILLGRPAYRFLEDRYLERGEDLPFVDYYHSFLGMHLPLLKVLSAPIPRARLYHSTCTGYAGLLACRARQRRHAPFILTEHGIYTNERHLEIFQARWLEGTAPTSAGIVHPSPGLQSVWIDMFNALGKIAYDGADLITTLYAGNRSEEVRLGADPSKVTVVPNGVDLDHFRSLPRRTDPARPTIALVGRVVPIKDIVVFLKACRVVADQVEGSRFLVLGTTSQDPAYYQKCLDYSRLLGLEERLEFPGNVQLDELYPQLDVLALTSIGEAQPLAVLEAMACGIPVVCTRVGACADLLLGQDVPDQAIGAAGLLSEVGDHETLGRDLVQLLKNPQLATQMGAAGKARVARYYDIAGVVSRYRDFYNRFLGGG